MEHAGESVSVVFGQGMRRIREAQGMKQETLARLAGYGDHSNIAKIEGGKTLPSLAKGLRLAEVLQVSLDAFMIAGKGEDWVERPLLEVKKRLAAIHARSNVVLMTIDELRQLLLSLQEELSVEEQAVLSPSPPEPPHSPGEWDYSDTLELEPVY